MRRGDDAVLVRNASEAGRNLIEKKKQIGPGGLKMANYVVLGAAGGIGSELCRRIVAKEDQVWLAGRTEATLQALADSLGSRYSVLDAGSFEQVQACLTNAASHFGKLDGVANCVGSLLLKPAHLTTEADWQAVLQTNLTSAFATVRAAVGVFQQHPGSIVLVSSAAAQIGLANHEAIAAAKAGVVGLMLAAAASYASRGIRINCVAPGMVHTQLTAKLLASEIMKRASAGMHALGRVGEPGDVAAAIQWLLSPEQSWVTGQVLGIDGGLSRIRSRA